MQSYVLSLTTVAIIIVLLATTASCACLVPANSSLALDRNDFVSVFDNSAADIDANFDALNTAAALLNVTFTRTQLAAFLGTVRFNTENLRRHQARCADTGSCAAQYDDVCANRSQNDTRHFYPRSALMITYQCNYADLDAFLRSSLPCLRSIESEPNLVSDQLLYSYLAAVAAWTNTECMALTESNLERFGVCMDVLNPWMCTAGGQEDLRDLVASVNVALASLNVTDVAQLPANMSCDVSFPSDFFNATSSNATQFGAMLGNDTSPNWTEVEVEFGALSRALFRSYFPAANLSTLDLHYDSVVAALLFNSVHQLDSRQIAFILASIDTRTASLTATESPGNDTARAAVSVQIAINLLSHRLPSSGIVPTNTDLIVYYISLISEIVQSGCMDDVRQSLYDVCLGAMFSQQTCAADITGHDAFVDDIQRAFDLEKVARDAYLLKCQDEELTSDAIVSRFSIRTVSMIVVAIVMTTM